MAKVYCENEFCIYWKKGECICREIALNAMGNCETGIHVTIPEETLFQKREDMLEKIRLNK